MNTLSHSDLKQYLQSIEDRYKGMDEKQIYEDINGEPLPQWSPEPPAWVTFTAFGLLIGFAGVVCCIGLAIRYRAILLLSFFLLLSCTPKVALSARFKDQRNTTQKAQVAFVKGKRPTIKTPY